MTTPIQTPGGGAPPGAPRGPEGAAGSGFSERVDPTASGAEAASKPQVTAQTDALIRGLVEGLDARRIDTPGAIDALVARALESPIAAGLTVEGRDRLERLIRTTLAEDPSLAALVRSLERR